MGQSYRQSILEWARDQRISVRNGTYPRPAASGSTMWWRLTPKEPKAQITFVHGTGDDAFFPFAALLKALLPRGVAAFLFDLDGHGRDSTTLFDERTITGALGDAWRHAETSLPHHVIGFSLGAALALHATRSRDIDPGSLVLIAPPLSVDGEWTDLLPELRALLSPKFWSAERTPLERLPAFGPFGRERFPMRLHDPREGYPVHIKNAINRCHLETTRNLSTPTLVIYGQQDRISKPRPREVWRQIAPKSKTQLVKDAAHFVLPDHRDAIARILQWYSSDCHLF